jgi:hypothetical protein
MNPKFVALVPQGNISNSLLSSVEFQLRESFDIERLCFILDLFMNRSPTLFESMRQRGFGEMLFSTIVYKYCNGDYGIDNSDLTRFCVFHSLIFKCGTKLIMALNNEEDIGTLLPLI